MKRGASGTILLALLFSLLSAGLVAAQETADQKVERIRSICAGISAKVERIERGGEDDRKAGIAVNELIVNTAGKSWPAVGTFRVVHRFYYEEDGEDPYPSKLLKIVSSTESAARRYLVEQVYGPSGALIFYFERSEDGDEPLERRVYFQSGKAFRIVDDGSKRDRLSGEDEIIVNEILAKDKKLRGIFEASLD